MNKPRLVLIEVVGGVAEVTVQPDDVEVRIVDFDVSVDMVCPWCLDERSGEHDKECLDMHPECYEKYKEATE